MILSSIVSAIINAVMDAPPAPELEPPPYALRSARNFSEQTKMGEMLPIQTPGWIVIDGSEYRVSSVLQARGPTNLIIMPMSIQRPTIVRYQFDNFGNVSRLWVLTRFEIETALARAVPPPPEETVLPDPVPDEPDQPKSLFR